MAVDYGALRETLFDLLATTPNWIRSFFPSIR